MKFPESAGSELVLSNNPGNRLVEVEILVDDVRAASAALAADPGVVFLEPPFETESGHVAVFRAPDGNVFVLVGG